MYFLLWRDYNEKKKLNVVLASIIIPIVFFLTIPPVKSSNTGFITYALGYPIPFAWYRSYNSFPRNNFILLTKELTTVQFDLLNFSLSCILTYFILKLLIKLFRRKQTNYTVENNL